MITQRHNLNIVPDKILPIVYASQFDTAREIEFQLYKENTEYTPDATSVYATIEGERIEAEVSGSVISFVLPASVTADSGTKLGEVVLENDGKIATCNFKLKVMPTMLKETV